MEGDLFPRGAGPNATPRIKKRNGEVLFAPETKRPRKNRKLEDDEESPVTKKAPVTYLGCALTHKRLSVGMTVLAVVARTNANIVELALPSGLRGIAVDDSLLDDEQLSKIQKPAFQHAKKEGDEDTDEEMEDSEDEEQEDEENEENNDDEKKKAVENSAESEDEGEENDEEDKDDDSDSTPQPLWKVLYVGQILPVSIVSTPQAGQKLFSVSLKPHLVNVGLKPDILLTKNFPAYASVLSVEDHGYILSFGSNISHTGFLPFNRCDSTGESSRLRVGAPIQVLTDAHVVVPKKKRNAALAIRVRSFKAELKTAALDVLESATFQDIRPGMLLRSRVLQEGPGGLSLLAMGVFPVSVDASHIPVDDKGDRVVERDHQVSARVLYVDPSTKLIAASMLQPLVTDFAPPPLPKAWKAGTLLKPLVVKTIRPDYGLALQLVADDERDATMVADDEDSDSWNTIPLFAFKKFTSDTAVKTLESKFSEGMVIEKGGRIVSKCRLDGSVVIDLRESVMNRKALSFDEIEVGDSYDCRIVKHTEKGIVVAVEGDSAIGGLIPLAHVSDVNVPLKKLSKHSNFQIGASLKCLVLSTKADRKRIYLTAKKSLLNPRYPLLTSLEDAAEALSASKAENVDGKRKVHIYSGSVLKISENSGLVIAFCNNINGFVHKKHLALDMSNRSGPLSKDEIESMYPIGQTVAVRVTSVQPNEQKLYLSMNLDSEDLTPGETVDGEIQDVNNDLKHFIVSVEKNGISIKCFLPFQHLSDVSDFATRRSAQLCQQLKTIKSADSSEGKQKPTNLKSALVVAHRDGKFMLSLKESLKQGVKDGTTPASFTDFVKLDASKKDGDSTPVVYGYVKSMQATGAVIGFLKGAVSFVRSAMIANQFVSDPASLLHIDQSVAASVESVDNTKERVNLTMRPSDVGLSCITERFARTVFKNSATTNSEALIGTIVDVTVTSIHEHGVEYAVPAIGAVGAEVDLYQKRLKSEKIALKVGKKKQAIVLDVDPVTAVLDVSRDAALLDSAPLTSHLKQTKIYSASVVLRKKSHAVLCVTRGSKASTKPAIAVALFNPLVHEHAALQDGSNVRCEVLGDSTQGRNIVRIVDNKVEAIAKSKAKPDQEYIKKVERLKQSAQVASEKCQNDVSGMSINAKVSKAHQTFATLTVGDGVIGNLHILHTATLPQSEFDAALLGPLPTNLADQFVLPGEKSRVMATVVGTRKRETDGKNDLVITDLATTSNVQTKMDFSVGQCVVAIVVRTTGLNGKSVQGQSQRGKLTLAVNSVQRIVCPDIECITKNDESTKVGTVVKCLITKCRDDGTVYGSVSENGRNHEAGEFFTGIVKEVNAADGVRVMLPWLARRDEQKDLMFGTVAPCDLSPDFDQAASVRSGLKQGSRVSVRHAGSCGRNVVLTMREESQESNNCKDQIIDDENIGKLSQGDRIRGFVKSISSKGCFLSIGRRGAVALVRINDLSDNHIANLEQEFPTGMVLQGTVVEVEVGKSTTSTKAVDIRVRMSVTGVEANGGQQRGKKHALLKDVSTSRLNANTLNEGSVLIGIVIKLSSYGVVVRCGPDVKGLLNKREHHKYVIDVKLDFVVGQKIHVVVIEKNEVANGSNIQLKLGTRKEYFQEAGVNASEIQRIYEKDMESLKKCLKESKKGIKIEYDIKTDEDIGLYKREQSEEEEEGKQNDSEDDDEEVVDESDDDGDDRMEDEEEEEEDVKPLKVNSKFVFDATTGENVDGEGWDEEDEEEGARGGDKKKASKERRDKKRQKEAEEAEIQLREDALSKVDNEPETAEDFERMLVSEGNSSTLWMEYMAYCIGLSQMDKARGVAERALETIDVSLEGERLNVWIAYINLEAQLWNLNAADDRSKQDEKSGVLRREAAVMRVFERGCERVTDVEKFHLQVGRALLIGEQDKNVEEKESLGEKILQRGSGKFKSSERMWVAYGESLYKNGNIKRGREGFERALKSVDKKKHGRVICKMGQLEFKYGSQERGRTVFESLVGNVAVAKKVVDVWNIYLDMEEGVCAQNNEEEEQQQQVGRTRALYERFVGLSLSSKKMKFGFKKWLAFEKHFGGKEEQRAVKNRAREYVERISTS